ncbi:hypothetical protein COL36_10385 [Bacillus wiedmannii]|uniref:hypothetical protein n=1 Tax=Bacillus cereus group TaxID=86661 RepID=UPI0003045667|nr:MULTISPECIES: hypothetical protein [Bacillus cereus group]PFX61608.1 hypothetical protein COL36_10385 [Bacillus wiedmannii]
MSYNTFFNQNYMSNLEKNDKEQFNRCNIVATDFTNGRKNLLPRMNPSSYKDLTSVELYNLFIDTFVLAGGAESRYVKQEYKTLFVQLSFQISFLIGRIYPNSFEAEDTKSDLNTHWQFLITSVEEETKLLGAFFANIKPLLDADGNPPVVFNPFIDGDVYFWSINEIAFVLDNLEDLGVKFKTFLKVNNVNV